MASKYILDLADPQATLENVGGKGASLARLARAGLPVPGGFHVTTSAYRKFVDDNGLQERILGALPPTGSNDIEFLEQSSRAIAALFSNAAMPTDVEAEISQAYAELPGGLRSAPLGLPVVAVRSSATAEDLPDLSFAGQQETYLNISGLPAVLDAVKRCWASLWTARAIGYRGQHGIQSQSISLAVVVQSLVNAEAAGVMFTANPANGRRDQAMITAAWGLGEAIVAGLVTPDTLVVDKSTGHVVNRDTASKEVITVPGDNGSGTREQALPENLRAVAVLSDPAATGLTRFGVQIEALYGQPMDIEWAIKDGDVAILQARPITALPEPQVEPPTEWKLPNPKGKYGRGSITDFMPDPLTPLFRTLGGPVIEDLARRMYARTTGMQEWPMQVHEFINDYAYLSMNFPPRLFLKVMKAGLGQFSYVFSQGERSWREDSHPNYVRTIERWQQKPAAEISSAELLEGTRQLMWATAFTYTTLQTGVIPAASGSEVMFTQVYNRLVKKKADPVAATFLLGYESAPIQAEKALYDLAAWARTRAELAGYLCGRQGSEIAADLEGKSCPAGVPVEDWQALMDRFAAYLEQYGHALYDLDFSKPVPADDPDALLETVRLYLTGGIRSPYERIQSLRERGEQAEQSILKRIGGLRRKWFVKSLKSAQKWAPLREDGLADLGLGYPLLRRLLFELGRRLVAAGALEQKEDIFWLLQEEAQEAAAALDRGETSLPRIEGLAQRKAVWNAEKRVTPPTMLPVGSRIFGLDVGAFGARTEGQEGDTIRGTGAFPGRITGVARVLHGPEEFSQMQPGEILVAAITTPAWTPLFAKAAAIVTDVGGPLSHSSIVAREYGIPAVLGTGVATRRIQTGQVITVDGSAGTVSLKNNGAGR